MSDPTFREILVADSRDRKYTEPNMNFLIEEIVVAHILREKLVDLPRTLVKSDAWRLIAYPGLPLASDIYQWNNRILPQKEGFNPYAGSQYDLTSEKLCVFADDDLNKSGYTTI
jgi:hypothetical protein